jgi:competence protein ComEC
MGRALRRAVRVLITVSCGFVLGLLVPAGLSGEVRAVMAACSLAIGLVCVGAHRRRVPVLVAALTPTLLGSASLIAGLAVGSPARAPPILAPAGLARLVVEIEEVSHLEPGRGLVRARVIAGERIEDHAAIPTGLRLLVTPYALPEGARVQMLAKLSPDQPFRNPSPHAALASARTSQAHAVLAGVDAFRVLEHSTAAWLLWSSRRALRERFDATLPPDVAAVARSLVLGDPDALPEADQADVRASGLAHVFAVSGMHVALLAGLVTLGLSRGLSRWYAVAARWDTRRVAAALGIPLALAIGVFTGAAPSGVRAAVTTALSWALIAVGRQPEPAAVTAFGCLLYSAFAPTEALRPAFLLSVAATAALVSDAPVKASSLREIVVGASRLSVRTTIATAPLVLWTFGTLPVWGVFANLLLVPVGSLLLVLAALHGFVACACPLCDALTGLPLCVASRAFLRGCQWFSAIDPHASWPVLSDAQGCIVSLMASLALFARSGRLRTWSLIAGVAALGLAEWHLRHTEKPHGSLRATFVDVGQGDATLIDLPDGRCVLIDGGGNPQGGRDPGERALVPLLAARRRSTIDLVVLSHPHPDHYQGLAAVLKAVTIKEVWDSRQAEAEAAHSGTAAQALAWLRQAAAKGAVVRSPRQLCGRPRIYGGAKLDVLWPCPEYDPGYDPNDNSLVVSLSFGAHRFLFAGDIEAHAEAALVKDAGSLRANVLKVPHHGSATSSSPELVRAVAPQLAIISAGAVNRFGHPNPEVVARLRDSGANVIELSRAGGTIVSSDGKVLRVEP